jgi:plasmid maintenance system antidote protein VapI
MPGPREGYRPLCSCRDGCIYCEVDSLPVIREDHWLLRGSPPPPLFGEELTRAIGSRRMSVTSVARAAGMTREQVNNLLAARSTAPTLATAKKLAAVLDWDGLESIALQVRTTACAVCRRPFTDLSRRRNRRYCSHACRITGYSRHTRGARRGLETIARRRVARYQDAVEAFCRQCAPDLVCRRSECPLRAVSPLPLAPEGALRAPLPGEPRRRTLEAGSAPRRRRPEARSVAPGPDLLPEPRQAGDWPLNAERGILGFRGERPEPTVTVTPPPLRPPQPAPRRRYGPPPVPMFQRADGTAMTHEQVAMVGKGRADPEWQWKSKRDRPGKSR